MIIGQPLKTTITTFGIIAMLTTTTIGVGTITLHRQALGALPGQTLVVRFSSGQSTVDSLAAISKAGAALASIGPADQSYRVHVIHPAAPKRLAKVAWIYREPLESLAHCLGLEPEPRRQLRHN